MVNPYFLPVEPNLAQPEPKVGADVESLARRRRESLPGGLTVASLLQTLLERDTQPPESF